MIRIFARLDADGLPVEAVVLGGDRAFSPDDPEAWTDASEIPADKSVYEMRHVGGEWVQRQALPAPAIETVSTELHYAWTGLPAGAQIEVIDVALNASLGTEAETGGALTVELVDTGTYRLKLTAGPDHLPQDFEVTVP